MADQQSVQKRFIAEQQCGLGCRASDIAKMVANRIDVGISKDNLCCSSIGHRNVCPILHLKSRVPSAFPTDRPDTRILAQLDTHIFGAPHPSYEGSTYSQRVASYPCGTAQRQDADLKPAASAGAEADAKADTVSIAPSDKGFGRAE